MTRQPLPQALAEAWLIDARRALTTLRAAVRAPALFKPDAVEQARREYAKALREGARWSA